MNYDFNWAGIIPALPYLAQGMKTTLLLAAVALALGFTMGCLLAVVRIYGPKPLAKLAAGYVNFFRAMPLILMIFWMFLLMPFVLRKLTGDPYLTVGPMYSAIIALVLAESAYFCEIVRAGIGSVRSGQMAAGKAIGMSTLQCVRWVVLPQALRNMSPSLVNQAVGLLKDTSLVYVISLNDFFGAAGQIGLRNGQLVEFYLFAAAVYLAICSTGVALANYLRKKNQQAY
ncbi:amino acid ABC transporter permease [Pseudomonas sp. KB-10]|uniref:amino acid ABC transporter permease n=1 Tax=Pseudomonas sp. KB-10 TaxID=2292264 RepID=UPI001BAE748E|nr:amino acid ABC transporter permease [Pseudomonas sp. KB-10]